MSLIVFAGFMIFMLFVAKPAARWFHEMEQDRLFQLREQPTGCVRHVPTPFKRSWVDPQEEEEEIDALIKKYNLNPRQ